MRRREPGGYRVINSDYCLRLIYEQCDSIAQLAEAAGVSRQFMTQLVGGRKTCRESVALSVARVLDQPLGALFMDSTGRVAAEPTKQTA